MITYACPDEQRLRDYLVGNLALADQEAVDDHLEFCPDCLAVVEGLDDVANSMFACLRQTSGSAVAQVDPEFLHLAKQVKELHGAPGWTQGREEKTVESAAGLVLGPYVLLRSIGAGGMGQVYQAEHQRMKRRVAVKLLSPEWLRSPLARARFQREIEAVARLSSPHIVAAYDAGESAGRDFLVMEYVEGRNLAEVVKQDGPLPVALALDRTLQAARGLEHAHAAGIIHRDVKPANLLVDEQGTVKILDLGLARMLLEPEKELTSCNHVMGTADFMAPEQGSDSRLADHRADIYSLGCTLFYLLTSRPPYQGKTNMDTLFAHRTESIPSIRAWRDDCPQEVDDLCRTLLAKNPENRPSSLQPVTVRLEELLAAVRQGSPPARRPGSRQWKPAAALLAMAASLMLGWVLAHLLMHPDGSDADAGGSAPLPQAPASVKRPVIDMVRIEPGEFWMGSGDSHPDAFDNEKPRHKVKMTRPFFLGRTKITQAVYQDVMGTNPSAFSSKGRFSNQVKDKDTSQHPVESISWLDAIYFCNRLSERCELTPFYIVDSNKIVTVRAGSTGYRLPTEAEWEFACRAGTDSKWSFGENPDDLGAHAWFADNSGDTTHPVGKKKANPWGLFDMHGNVPDWCWDRYKEDHYKESYVSNPSGPGGPGDFRVQRGGGWNMKAAQTRSAYREARGSTYAVFTIVGIRVARDVER